MSRERAIKTLVQGQQSENLLDMDDDPPTDSPSVSQQSTFGSNSLNASTSTRPAANPLDDLLGLFDNAGLGGGTSSNSFGGAPSQGLMDLSAPTTATQTNGTTTQKNDRDLLADLFD